MILQSDLEFAGFKLSAFDRLAGPAFCSPHADDLGKAAFA
jgi:hypothetical protein